MPETIDKLKAIQSKNSAKGLNTVISVCGGSCTGKSSQVARGILEYLKACVLLFAQDRYQHDADYITNPNPVYEWDHPRNFGIEKCFDALGRLKRNQSVEVPNYSFASDRPAGMERLDPRPFILFEGLYSSYDKLIGWSDFTIYVEAPFYARMLKRIFRNSLERYNYTPFQILERFLSSVMKAHNDFVIWQKEQADLIVEMPFYFCDLKERFGLKPVGDYQPLIIEYKYDIDADTSVTVERNLDSWSFNLIYKDKLYLNFAINREMQERLRSFDWKSL